MCKILFKKLKNQEKIPDEHLVFMLMPFKHHDIMFFFEFMEQKIENHSDSGGNSATISRFYKDSKKKWLISKNEQVVENVKLDLDVDFFTKLAKNWIFLQKNTIVVTFFVIILIFFQYSYVFSGGIVVVLLVIISCCKISFKVVCEHFPEMYTSDDWEIDFSATKSIIRNIHNNVKKNLDDGCLHIVVSLSGGVDSMLLSYLLNIIQRETNLCSDTTRHIHLSAVHINYRNRSESDMEQLFVEQWCNKLKIPLYVRVIDDITRGITDRKWYESVTRDIRFDLYKRIVEKTEGNGYIVLGHIKDDAIENIFTNFARGQHIFNLKKLQMVSKMYDVNVWRPLLNTKKDEIVKLAKKLAIPWLKNTTPAWSNRGKLRNKFIPAVEQQFGKKSFNNVEYVADTLAEYYDIISTQFIGPMINNHTRSNNLGTETFIPESCLNMGLHFWQTILVQLFHSRGISLPSRSAISHFVRTVKGCKSTIVNLKKEVYCYYDYNARTMYLLDSNKICGILNVDTRKLGNFHWKEIKKLL